MATTVSSLEYKINVELNNLRIKLQNQLKKDIFRLYSDSVFADISIYVENEAIKLHRCILQTRAPAFYSFYCQKPELIKFVPCHKLKIFFKQIYYDSEIKSKEDELLRCIETAFSIDKPLSLEESCDFELSHYFSINDSFIGTSTPKLHLLKDTSKFSSCVNYTHFCNSDNTAYYSLVDKSLVMSDFSDINEESSKGMNSDNNSMKSTSSEMNIASRDHVVADEPVQTKYAPTNVVNSTPMVAVTHINLNDFMHDAKKDHESENGLPAQKFFSSNGDAEQSLNSQSGSIRKFFIDASDLIDEDAANGSEKSSSITETCELQISSPLQREEPKFEYNTEVWPRNETVYGKTLSEPTWSGPPHRENECEELEVETSCTILLRNARISKKSPLEPVYNMPLQNENKWKEPEMESSCDVLLQPKNMHEVPKPECDYDVPSENKIVYVGSKVDVSYNLPIQKEHLCEKQTPDSLDDDPHLSNDCNAQHTPAELRNKLEIDFLNASLTEKEPVSCDSILVEGNCENVDPIFSDTSIPAIPFEVFKTYLIEKYECARKNHAYSDDELQRLKVFDELVMQDDRFTYLKCDLERMFATGVTKMHIAIHKFLIKQYEKHHKSTYSLVKKLMTEFLQQQEGDEQQKFDRTSDLLNESEKKEQYIDNDSAIVAEVDELFKKLLNIAAPNHSEPVVDEKDQKGAVINRSCGFFIDLKESPKPASEQNKKSLPSKQLFSMFIDFGNSTDSDSSLEVQNRLERRKKQYISKLEKSRELRNSATSLNDVEVVTGGGRKLEKIVQSTPLSCNTTVSASEKSTEEVKSVDSSTVVLRRSKNTNGTPHANSTRRSWNVDKTSQIDHNVMTKHKRSYSVSARQYEAISDAPYTVDINPNREDGNAEFPSIGNADSTNELTVNGESEVSTSYSYSEGGDTRTQPSVSNSSSAKVCTNGDLAKSEEICGKVKEKVFVKLSDMDKEPNTTSSTDQWPSVRMTKSAIGTETSWFETKLLNGSVNSRSLSRIFPDLSASVLSKPNSDMDDTTVSSMSSVQSSSAVSTCESNLELSNNASKNDNNALGQDLLKMFLDEISTDVVVEVAGRRIKAHKCILTSRCQYFAALLSGGWVESAGNVLSIHGFSFNVVHFALCYIYSGESEIPENISIVELASLADYLCLEGLKEVVSCTLKMRYCHFFHKPCSICSVGVLECLPIAVNYGLDEIHRKSLRWITKHYVRLWCSKAFATLPRELIDKCYNQHVVNMAVNNVFETLTNCDKLFTLIPQTRWAEPCFTVTRKLHDFCIKFLANHFVEFLKSDAFMSIATNRTWGIIIMDEKTQLACSKMRSDQLCQSYAYISGQSKLAMASHENEELIELLNRVKHQIETALVKIALQACQCTAWFQMDPELRSHIQTSAGLTFVPSEAKRRVESFKQRPPTISSCSGSVDLQQVKTAISRQHRQANNARSHELKSSKPGVNQKSNSHHGRSTSVRQNGSHSSQNKENKGSGTKASSHGNSKSPFRNKYANVKSRYMENTGGKTDRATASETTPSETSEIERRSGGANKRPSKSLASSVHLSPGASIRQTARAVSLSKIPVSMRNSSQKRAESDRDTTSGSDNGVRQEQRRSGPSSVNSVVNRASTAVSGRRPASSHSASSNGVGSRAHPAARKSCSSVNAESRSMRSPRVQGALAGGRRKANGVGGAVSGKREPCVSKRKNSVDAVATSAAPDSTADTNGPSNPSSNKNSVSEEIARPDIPFRRDGTFCIDEPTVLKKQSPSSEQADIL